MMLGKIGFLYPLVETISISLDTDNVHRSLQVLIERGVVEDKPYDYPKSFSNFLSLLNGILYRKFERASEINLAMFNTDDGKHNVKIEFHEPIPAYLADITDGLLKDEIRRLFNQDHDLWLVVKEGSHG